MNLRYLHKNNIGEVLLLLRTNHVTKIICLLEHDYGELEKYFWSLHNSFFFFFFFFTNYDINIMFDRSTQKSFP